MGLAFKKKSNLFFCCEMTFLFYKMLKLLILSQALALQNAIMCVPPSFRPKLVSMKCVLLFCIIFNYLGHDVTGFLIQRKCFSSTSIFLFFSIPSLQVFLALIWFVIFAFFGMFLSDTSSLNLCCISSFAVLEKLLLPVCLFLASSFLVENFTFLMYSELSLIRLYLAVSVGF